jgi:hypothetical protein
LGWGWPKKIAKICNQNMTKQAGRKKLMNVRTSKIFPFGGCGAPAAFLILGYSRLCSGHLFRILRFSYQ